MNDNFNLRVNIIIIKIITIINLITTIMIVMDFVSLHYHSFILYDVSFLIVVLDFEINLILANLY